MNNQLINEEGDAGGDAGGASSGSVSGGDVANVVAPLGTKYKNSKDKKKNQPKVTLITFLRRNGWNTL